MQKAILKYKHHLLLIVTILLALAIIVHLVSGYGAIVEILLVIASILGGAPIFVQAFQALKVRVVSIDLLVSIAIVGALFIKNFEESAVVAFLFLLGSYLEQRTLNKTRSAIQNLVELSPETALRQELNGEFVETDIDEIDVSDTLLVKTGASVPVDGVVIYGSGTINEASITGESVPVTKEIGAKVFAGTILEDGMLHVEAERIGEETTFGKIIELVEEAQDSKSEAERFIDRFAKYYTPFILLLAIAIWMITRNIELAVTILVLGCPGALVIGVPVSNVAGLGNGAKNGVLLKGSEVIHRLSHIDTILFDKTGTLTYGTPRVNEEIFYTKHREKAISYLVSMEKSSNHPLAKAILDQYNTAKKHDIDDLTVVKGEGMTATVDGQHVIIGNCQILERYNIAVPETIKLDIARLENEGHTIVITVIDEQIALINGIQDQVREGLEKDLERLNKLGVKKRIVLSGDNQGTVDRVVKKLNLTEGYGNMLPDEKSAVVRQLQDNGETVAFIGDGINDSPSLALADIGMAMGSGTDVAIETSNVVLMNEDFHHLPHAIGLAKSIRRNMIQNIVIALAVVLVLLLSIIFSDWMNMAIGMFVHEASILVVILNGMRLLNYKQK
ncbi:copper-translocating P-type ATPase [Staphylococcus muscae]|uniref:Cd(2+)-exporting ATPase n=1 Tax=Staphylococcus muscae TaxID=1294 RepID=A0A240C1Q5_9STAP|nr:heavy metal translocating P-type ATPase [Staphylococcus muscae]AVQ32853.1 copper-translocating P-type ATPase [Staphylococcus muscae]PNZ06683.1 copper-translocating P-type ATPase [Staphylococcus muscae]GGA80659.1 haloacid dehalogenase [Staphylococcus muscae]SNW01860.1 cadmium-transporting ATPase [Staphylococcus muscae]